MPEGQFTGARNKYVYTDDGGKDIILTLDSTLAALSPTLVVFDPANPGTAVPAPKRFQPRGVWWQATATGFVGKRKFLVMGDTSEATYASNISVQLTVDGVQGKTTGRRGEKLSY